MSCARRRVRGRCGFGRQDGDEADLGEGVSVGGLLGTLEGKKVGVAIFDHPSSFRYPTYWHARDYGLFAANAFGLHDFFNDKSKDGSYTLEKGKTMHFRYRVVIHPGDTAEANIGKLFEEWSRSREGAVGEGRSPAGTSQNHLEKWTLS